MTASAARMKHLWIQGVCADQRFSGDAVRILVYVADRYVMSGECAFSIKQATVAMNLGFRKRQTVGDAFQRACELGWLERYERQRGRGRRAGDAYILGFPADRMPTSSGEEIRPPSQTYFDELGPSSRTSSGEEYVRDDGEIGPPPRQNRSAATVEIGPPPRHGNPSTPAETPDLNDVIEWFSTNDVKTNDVALEDPEPDHSVNFGHLFGFIGNGHGHRTLPSPAVIDAETVATEERGSGLRSTGALTADTTMLVNPEAHKAGLLAQLVDAYPDDFKASA